jgi:hypothetical protein
VGNGTTLGRSFIGVHLRGALDAVLSARSSRARTVLASVPGYMEFLSAIQDPKHAEHDSMLARVGGAFAPEGFDLNAINRTLRFGRS